MKIERRELVRQLSPETAVNVLLACWDFLETGEKPAGLSPIENVAFSSFMPDMDEAWVKYIKRISSGAKGGRPSKEEKPYGSIRPHTDPYGTEEETETDSKKEYITPLTPQRGKQERFMPPSVEEVATYCVERQNGIDAEEFVAFYESKGWKVGQAPMKSWKHAVVTWEKKRKNSGKEADPYAGVI